MNLAKKPGRKKAITLPNLLSSVRRSTGATYALILSLLLACGLGADGASEAAEKARAADSGARKIAAPDEAGGKAGAAAPGTEKKTSASETATANRLVRDGLVVDFAVTPLNRRAADRPALMEGEYAEVAFRITDAVNGRPVSGLYPAAWIDLSKPWVGERTMNVGCKDRVSLYLQGTVGFRPLIDLNSYFVLVMNRDATISVVDPLVGITGITQLYALINLKRPGADWAKTHDDKRLFVTMPRADEVAVVNAETFKPIENIAAGRQPTRIAIQPDGKYLWVGNDSKQAAESGVTVIDVEKRKVVAHIPTGKGHHEIALSGDSRYAYVTNRDDGSVSVIDVGKLKKIKQIKTGPQPISLAYSALSRTLYVVDAKTGIVSVIDGASHEVAKRLEMKPGLGPLRFSQDGRWGVVVNSQENVAHVVDAATNRVAHTIQVGDRPYQVAFSRSFAYVRALGSERVSMINLSELGKGTRPPVVTFAAGEKPPGQASDLSIADGIAETPGDAAVLVVSPADKTVYFYMEGMNAPMGALRNYGHLPRAVTVVDRALREETAGVYAGQVQLPAPGTYDVAFLLDTPRMLHCFSVEAEPNPSVKHAVKPLAIEYLVEDRQVTVGETVRLRFRLTDPATEQPRTGLDDVQVLYYLAPGRRRSVLPAREIDDGVYEVELSISQRGAYYVYVGAPSLEVRHGQLPYTTLLAVNRTDPRSRKAAPRSGGGGS